MGLRYWYLNDAGVIAEMTARINDPLRITIKAEEGVAAGSSLIVHDPTGSFNITGLRKVYVTEDAIVDDENRTIAVAYASKRTVRRGSPFVGRARDWVIDLFDLNTLLERRIMVGADCKRPAESDVERLQWLMSTVEAGLFGDDDFIFPDSPTPMDKVDYTGQSMKAIIDDCAQQSGKNYYGFNQDTGDASTGDDSFNDAHVWYGDDLLEDREADIRISNVATDIDGTTTLVGNDDWELERSPDRVASGVFVAYNGGNAYTQRASTIENFAARDVVSPSPNVKTKAKAKARGQRYLASLSTEEDIIKGSIVVAAALVNVAQEGERIECRFEHLPGYEDEFSWMRIIERTVEQLSPAEYKLSLVLSAPAPAVPPTTVYGILYASGGPYTTENGTALIHWANPGDTPGPGFLLRPTVGPLTVLTDASPPHPDRTHYGWRIDGDGDIDVTAYASVYGIKMDDIAYTWTLAIRLNGSVVASEVRNPTPGNLSPEGWDPVVSIASLSVVDGDIITATLETTPSFPAFWRTPFGSGQSGERLEITAGTLV